jgi:hypothetical protein
VEVTRKAANIEVRALAADPERQAQIRTALAGLPFVTLRFEQPEEVRSAAPVRGAEAEAPKTNALIDRLTAQLSDRDTVENFTNHVLDLSEAALARAHALRALATRFPPDTESALAGTDRATLQEIQADHTRRLVDSVRQLSDTLKPVVKAEPAVPDRAAYSDWRTGTESVLSAAQTLDRALTNALAGSGAVEEPDQALSRLAASAADLQSRAAALRTVVARAGANP